MEEELETLSEQPKNQNHNTTENHDDQVEDKNGDEAVDDTKWWENESQFLLSSQQLVEGLSLCDELLQSQSPNRDGNENGRGLNHKPLLSDYARLGPEDLKKDLEDCQCLVLDPSNPANIELDTPPDFRLSQLEFESQESYIAWGGNISSKVLD
ncbi:NAC domain-containing protein 8 [Abeliophyllum distichum]|uniref:NAC domain-containing protein 8 n=1 Tax=Abeliophyllum distichum TaxID=126358 RepID=A0ABD1U2A6_9LAMI